MQTALVVLTEEQLDAKIQAAIELGFSRFSQNQSQHQPDNDEIGSVEDAARWTGKAVPTIYGLCSKRLIPHSKRGNQLYFSKKEIMKWLRDGKRKTASEIKAEAIAV